jgi:hypothetical protein
VPEIGPPTLSIPVVEDDEVVAELHDAIRGADVTTILPKPLAVDDVLAAIESAVAASSSLL